MAVKLPVHIKKGGDLSNKVVLETVQSNSVEPDIEIAASAHSACYNLLSSKPCCLLSWELPCLTSLQQAIHPSCSLQRQRVRIPCPHSHVRRRGNFWWHLTVHPTLPLNISWMVWHAWHEMPAEAHTSSQTESGDLKSQTDDKQKFCMCSPKKQECFPAQEPAKTPPAASSLCMRAARQHCEEECQALLYLWFLGPVLRGILGTYFPGKVECSPHKPCSSPRRCSLPTAPLYPLSLEFLACRNLQPPHSMKSWPFLVKCNVKCKKEPLESLLSTSSYGSIKIYLRYIYQSIFLYLWRQRKLIQQIR